MWPFKKKAKEEVKPLPHARGHFANSGTNATLPQRDSGSDFMTGFLVAEAMSGGNAEAGLLGGVIGGVEGGIIGAELAPHETPQPDSSPFGGGESGGGGASGSWDTPSCDTCSTDSSSSSCDSGSSSSSDF